MDPRTVSVRKLYRDCLRLADYVGTLQGAEGQAERRVAASSACQRRKTSSCHCRQ